MIQLINGKGQLGSALQEIIEKERISPKEKIYIYHTWNIEDKSEETQKQCYLKFQDFVRENLAQPIIFVSTYSQTDNYYNYYKQLSEAYLLSNTSLSKVIRLPTLIGKGICQKFRDGITNAYGEMELMSVEEAAREILKFSLSNSIIRNFRVYGKIVSADLAKRLILFGKEDK